jgi:hypothetical protein
MTTRVQVFGDGAQSKQLFENVEVEYVDNDPDIVVMEHTLQLMPRNEVVQYLTETKRSLPEGGQIMITVPSLDWACRKIVQEEEPDFAVYYSIYGLDGNTFKCGFTLYWLRLAVQAAGFRIEKAVSEPYQMGINGQPQQAFQHLVVGRKITSDPAEAIA